MTTKLIVNKYRSRSDTATPHVPPSAAPAQPVAASVLGQINTVQMTAEQLAAAQRAAAAAKAPAPARKVIGDDAFFPVPEDGFGGQTFATARRAAPPSGPTASPTSGPTAPPTGPSSAQTVSPAAQSGPADVLDAIKSEGLTGRQLRMARRLAQKHNLPATSDFDAVRLLREAGMDPFQANSVLEMVSGAASSNSRELALSNGVQLPQTIKPIQVPSVEDRAAETHIAEVRRIQREIVARRRKKSMLLAARMGIFVLLPTLLAGYYFYNVATPFYSTKTEFLIQQAEAPSASGSGLSGLMKGSPLGNSTDSITVQGYLQSQEAMERLNQDNGFRAHFSDPKIDTLQRMDPEATNTSAYKTYRKRVKISYDPTEGIIKMEVIAADPAVAVDISKSLIKYAEEQVDQMTLRVRTDQMQGAEQSYLDAEAKLSEANERVVTLQEKNKVLSSEVEIGLLTAQIGQLDGQLTQDRLSLAQMESNETPNESRMAPLKRRITTLQAEIADLRSKLTENSVGGQSLARIQSELFVAQADVETRRLLLAQSLAANESARTNANRQTRYLSISVNPIAADEAAYPRAFENTLVVMLIFAGLYLMLSMTVAILREQITA